MHSPLIVRFFLIAILAASTTGAVHARSELAAQAEDIMQNRCMVCHGCYDAPCQLKLEARAGLERGASKAPVYD